MGGIADTANWSSTHIFEVVSNFFETQNNDKMSKNDLQPNIKTVVHTQICAGFIQTFCGWTYF